MKKNLIAIAALALLCGAAVAQTPPDYHQSLERAGAAFEAEDWPALNDALDDAQAVLPWSLHVYRNRILARMLAGRKDDALALAAKAADRGLSLTLAGRPAFEELTSLAEFAPIAARMAANAAPLGAASSVREFSETGLLPEAITFDRKKNLYIGSVRNGSIYKAGKKDKALTLIANAPGGVFDLEVRDGLVWAAVNNQLAYANADPEHPFAAVTAFNAKTGAPVREIRVGEDTALLGDLEIAKDGTVYASDSLTPQVFRMAPGGHELDVFAADARFANVQGIALDEAHHRLFAADYLTGLFVIDTQTGAVTQLDNDADAHLGGIDGLYLYKGGLIGIQNGTTPQRIVQIGLNEEMTAVTDFIVRHQNLEGWNEPTHGVIVKNDFHYIATSNWPSYGEDGSVKEDAQLQPLRIITLSLESR